MRWPFGFNVSELLFRMLFSSIFLGLGAEHLFDDRLIMELMPAWVLVPRPVSIAAGLLLLTGGGMVLLGWQLKKAAWLLGTFLVVVTAVVHVPGVIMPPPVPAGDEAAWMWTVLQRSNLVKNMCLLGVCIQLGWHRPGFYSMERWLQRRREGASHATGAGATAPLGGPSREAETLG